MRKPLLLPVLLACVSASAQRPVEHLRYGLRVGACRSEIFNLRKTFFEEESRPNYTITETPHVTPGISIFAQYRFPVSQVAAEGSLSYSLNRMDIGKRMPGHEENYEVKLHHLMLGLAFKVYARKGAFARVGIESGPCLNSSSCVIYKNSSSSGRSRMQQAERIRRAVKGRSQTLATASLGYDFDFGLTANVGYSRGLTDLMEVGVNPYGFSEARNACHSFSLNVGWAITRHGFNRM